MSRKLVTGLTVFNTVLLIVFIAGSIPTISADEQITPVLRGRALEIVDGEGRIRASISVHGPTTVSGVRYPETVLLRLTDPKSGPVVKLTAAQNGAALGLSDDANRGIQLYARDTASFVKVVDKLGRERVFRP